MAFDSYLAYADYDKYMASELNVPCPVCGKDAEIEGFNGVSFNMNQTVGSLIDKNSSRMSSDEKTHLDKLTRKKKT
jgi:hypothetical protein